LQNINTVNNKEWCVPIKIAFFDSGQGGLTVWEKVVEDFPSVSTVYLGDNARCPYGNKSAEVIRSYTRQAIHFLLEQKVNFVAIVCGTASSVSIESLRSEFKIPIIGIIEGLCKFASLVLKESTKPVAVLATRFTIQTQKFKSELQNYNIHNIWQKACPVFAPLVEDGISDGPMIEQACELYLNDIPKTVKIVLLACTHYPRIVEPISRYLYKKTNRSVLLKKLDKDVILAPKNSAKKCDDPIYLIEASTSIHHSIEDVIKNGHFKTKDIKGRHKLFCTDAPHHFEMITRYFTQIPLPKTELVNISGIL